MFNTVALALVAISASAIHISEGTLLNQNVAKDIDIAKKQAPGQMAPREDLQTKDVKLINVFKDGPCPKVDLMKNIEYTRLAGDWYLHSDTCPISRIVKPECNHCVLDI